MLLLSVPMFYLFNLYFSVLLLFFLHSYGWRFFFRCHWTHAKFRYWIAQQKINRCEKDRIYSSSWSTTKKRCKKTDSSDYYYTVNANETCRMSRKREKNVYKWKTKAVVIKWCMILCWCYCWNTYTMICILIKWNILDGLLTLRREELKKAAINNVMPEHDRLKYLFETENCR